MIKINWTEQFIKQQTECLDMLTELIEYDKQHGEPPEKARVLEGFIDTQRRALDMATKLLEKHKPALEEAEKAEREKRQAHVFSRLVRRAQLKRLAGDALHHPYVLRFQVCAGEVQHEPEDDAQHDGHDAHVDDHEFDTQFFYHSCSTSR